MKVAQLAQFLDSLVHGLEGVINVAVSKDFKSFSEAMRPFGNASVSEFTSFLGQFGAEFQQTGKISEQGKISLNKPTKTLKLDGSQQVAIAVARIHELFAEIDRGSVNDYRVEQVLEPFAKLPVPLLHEALAGLKIAERPRTKAKIIDKIRQVVRHQMESHTKAASVGG